MTYNIWQGGKQGAWLHRAVRDADPDILLVNECPKLPILGARRCRELARAWGLEYVAGGRDGGGNMIAVRAGLTVRSHHTARIPQPCLQPIRGLVTVQVDVGGQPLGLVACHLSLDARRRRREVERVVAAAGRLTGAVVVGGDLNEPPGQPCWRRLEEAGYVDHGSAAWRTYPTPVPVKRIDALVVRGPVQVVSHGDPEVEPRLLARASDHLPVLAELEV
jgi:endonuclease/exonuclease/phosphatase family metal-dependent hydrolase